MSETAQIIVAVGIGMALFFGVLMYAHNEENEHKKELIAECMEKREAKECKCIFDWNFAQCD